MRLHPASTARPARALAVAAAIALVSGVPVSAGATGVAPRAGLFAAPSAIATLGPWVVVANQQTSSLTVLHASTGTLAGRVGSSLLGVKSPEALVAANVGGRREVLVSGAGGAISVLAIAAKGAGVAATRVRTIHPTGCAAGTASHLALDGRGHVVEACASGAVTEWTLSTGMLLRQYNAKQTGLTNAVGIAVQGTNAYVTNAATAAASTAPDGVAELSLLAVKHLRTVTNTTNPALAFDSPHGIASDGTHLWVTSTESNTVDELSSTLAFLQSSSTNLYDPGAVLATKAFVWVSSVNGPVQSMVTQFTVASPAQSPWMMCNTNDAYKFDDPSAFALGAGSLWVANASDSLVDQMNATSGTLTRTVG